MIPLQSPSPAVADSMAGLELDSLARAARVIDSLLKAASVRLLCAQVFSGGRMLVLFDGDVESVDRSLKAGLSCGGQRVVDQLLIENLHRDLVMGLDGDLEAVDSGRDALLFLETASICAQIRGLDSALKSVPCQLAGLRLGRGIAGQAIALLTGGQADLEAARQAFEEAAGAGLIESQLIPRPDEGPDWGAMFRPETNR